MRTYLVSVQVFLKIVEFQTVRRLRVLTLQFEVVPALPEDVDVLGEDLLVLAVVGGLQGFGEMGPFLVDHLDDHAQGLRHDEDVREDDGGVY